MRSQLGASSFVGGFGGRRGGVFTAGWRADGTDPCVRGSGIFIFFYERLPFPCESTDVFAP